MLSGGRHVLDGKRQDFASGPKSLTTHMFVFLLYFFQLCVCAPIWDNDELQHRSQQTHSQRAHSVCAGICCTKPRCTDDAGTGVAKEGVVARSA